VNNAGNVARTKKMLLRARVHTPGALKDTLDP
jgi:hypothetical protein